MSSTFGMLEAARSGLNAAQIGMSVTSQNQSNADTEGYTRQAIDTSAIPADSGAYRYSTKDNLGRGVKINSVYQIRDSFLDVRYRYANSTYSMYSSMQSQMTPVEDQFNEIGTGTATSNKLQGLAGSVTDLINSLGSYGTSSTNTDLSADVYSKADYIASSIRSDASFLNTTMSSEMSELNNYVTGGAGDTSNGVNNGGINGIIENIQSLNTEIQSYELTGKSANDLRDQRNLALDKLSNYIDIDTTEQANGMVTVKLKNDDDNMSIIDAGNTAHEFQVATTSKGNTVLAWGDTLTASGSRMQNTIPGKINVTTSPYDTTDIANVQGGIVKAYLNVINGDGSGTDDPATGQCGNIGVAYMQKKLNDFAISFMNVMNNNNSGVGTFSASHFISYKTGTTENYTLSAATDDVASSIQVSSGWSADKELFINNYTGANKATYYNEYYAALQSTTAMDTANNGVPAAKKISLLTYASSFSTDLATAVGKISDNASQAETTKDNLGDQRDAISSVSSNDEAVNLIKYQQAYSASARIITAIDEMLDKLINGTGKVGLS